jgi:adenylate cyclase
MGFEIERKYLVKKDLWEKVEIDESVLISQGYLSIDPERTVRIRTTKDKGFVTIKGAAKGISRLEFEYEIPLTEAKEIIDNLTSNAIEKVRHLVTVNGKLWEVDEFLGANAGLIVAEIELQTEDEQFLKPAWIDKEVTDDRRYSNSNLSANPFKTW